MSFSEYINEATQMMQCFFSENKSGKEEQKYIADYFSDYIQKNIGHPERLGDYEKIIYNASIVFVDRQLSNLLSLETLSFTDCEEGIELCNRQKHSFEVFTKYKWIVPNVNNKDIDSCNKRFIHRQEEIKFDRSIVELDRDIDASKKSLHNHFSSDSCDDLLRKIDKLENYINISKTKGYSISALSNGDTISLRYEFLRLRDYEQDKEQVLSCLINDDKKVYKLICQKNIDEEVVRSVNSLCDLQFKRIDNCIAYKWRIPDLKVNYEITCDMYSHFLKMFENDKVIQSYAKNMNDDIKVYKKTLNQQVLCIEKCKEMNWRLPDISVKDPESILQSMEATQASRERKRKLVKKILPFLIIVLVCLPFVFVWGIKKINEYFRALNIINGKTPAIAFSTSSKETTSDSNEKKIKTTNSQKASDGTTETTIRRIYIPLSSAEIIGMNHNEVTRVLKQSGFTNVQEKEISSGWVENGIVIGVSADGINYFNSSFAIKPDDPIIIQFSCYGRKNVGDLLDGWSNKDYTEIKSGFIKRNKKSVDYKKVSCDESYKNFKVAYVKIDDMEYVDGDCFVLDNQTIVIGYYARDIQIGYSNESIQKLNYSDVVLDLKSRGFRNIRLKRANNLITGLITKEGSIQSMTIKGETNYSDSYKYNCDDLIEIVVNTFKNRGCDDITDVVN